MAKTNKIWADYTGMSFNRWLVLEYVGKDKKRNKRYKCRCECGNESVVSGWVLNAGLSKSCGCLKLGVN